MHVIDYGCVCIHGLRVLYLVCWLACILTPTFSKILFCDLFQSLYFYPRQYTICSIVHR